MKLNFEANKDIILYGLRPGRESALAADTVAICFCA